MALRATLRYLLTSCMVSTIYLRRSLSKGFATPTSLLGAGLKCIRTKRDTPEFVVTKFCSLQLGIGRINDMVKIQLEYPTVSPEKMEKLRSGSSVDKIYKVDIQVHWIQMFDNLFIAARDPLQAARAARQVVGADPDDNNYGALIMEATCDDHRYVIDSTAILRYLKNGSISRGNLAYELYRKDRYMRHLSDDELAKRLNDCHNIGVGLKNRKISICSPIDGAPSAAPFNFE